MLSIVPPLDCSIHPQMYGSQFIHKRIALKIVHPMGYSGLGHKWIAFNSTTKDFSNSSTNGIFHTLISRSPIIGGRELMMIHDDSPPVNRGPGAMPPGPSPASGPSP